MPLSFPFPCCLLGCRIRWPMVFQQIHKDSTQKETTQSIRRTITTDNHRSIAKAKCTRLHDASVLPHLEAFGCMWPLAAFHFYYIYVAAQTIVLSDCLRSVLLSLWYPQPIKREHQQLAIPVGNSKENQSPSFFYFFVDIFLLSSITLLV